MLSVSLNSTNYNNINYGNNKAKVVTKPVSNVAKNFTPTVKKSISIGTLIASLFGIKKSTEIDPNVNVQKSDTNKKGYREEKVYDEYGRLTNILKFSNADDVLSIDVSYDTKTGNIKQKEYKRKDGITTQYIEQYNTDGKKVKFVGYCNNGNNVRWVEFYNKREDIPKEVTWYNRKGKIEEQVNIDEATGNINNRFKFDDDGNLTERAETSSLTGYITKNTKYSTDGTKVVQEFDIISGKPTNTFKYDKNHRLVDWTTTDNNANKKIYFTSHIVNKNEYDEDLEDIPNKKRIDKNKTLLKQNDENISNFLEKRYEMEHAE